MAISCKLVSFLCLATLLCTKSASSNGIENYVEQKLQELPQWIRNNNFDPSPVVTGPTILRAANVFCNVLGSLSDHGVQGHSEKIEVDSVIANLQSAEILASFTLHGNIKFSGKYTASGTLVTTDTPLSGDGSWYIQSPSIQFQNVTMNWVATSTGHLSITKFKFTAVKLAATPEGMMEMQFDNLWDDDPTALTYQQVIQEAIYLAFQDSLTQSGEHAIKKMLTQYLQQIFTEKPLSEIVGVTRPLPTSSTSTTAAPSPTSELPSSSSPSTTTRSTGESANNDDDGKWEFSKGMFVLFVLWGVAIILIAVMVTFIAKMLITQSRHSNRMGITVSPHSVNYDYPADSRIVGKQ